MGLKVPWQLLQASPCFHPTVFDEYLKIAGKPIERSIRGELSGDFEKLMLAVGKPAPHGDPAETHHCPSRAGRAQHWGQQGQGCGCTPGIRELREAPSGRVGMLMLFPWGVGAQGLGALVKLGAGIPHHTSISLQ